jgi:hypothetical protein
MAMQRDRRSRQTKPVTTARKDTNSTAAKVKLRNRRGRRGRGFNRLGRQSGKRITRHSRTLPDDNNPEYSAAAMKDW